MLKCDHNGVSIKIKILAQSRGNGCWKLNNSILIDEVFKENVTRIIRKVNTEYFNLNVLNEEDFFYCPCYGSVNLKIRF